MLTTREKGEKFASLHENGDMFILANAWDKGSSKILENIGFNAIGTTSAGVVYAEGRPEAEGVLSAECLIKNAADINAYVNLPVSVDLEYGGGLSCDDVAYSISQAIHVGLAGASIEDSTYNRENPIIDVGLATERIYAAAEQKKKADYPFTLTARAENYSCGIFDLKDTITRLQKFSMAGADVLYAPGLQNLQDIKSLCENLDKPVNIVVGYKGANFTFDDLKAAGVQRVSLGSSFARAAWGAFYQAAINVKNRRDFSFADTIPSFDDMCNIMK